MAISDISSSSLASFNSPGINTMIASAKNNKITLSNFSNYYLLENNIKIGFPMLRKFEHILRKNLIEYNIEESRYYRPEYVSFDLYGTTDLWYLIMFVNNFYRVEDFVGPKIKIPNYDVLSAINSIINDESDITHTTDNPLSINKNILKDLNKPSDIITRTTKDKTIDWVKGSEVIPKIDSIFNNNFYKSENYISSGYIKDENGNDVKAITLDKSGSKSIPSIYFREGFSRSFNGRIYLDSNNYYSISKLINGSLKFKIIDEGKEIRYDSFDNNFGEASIVVDNRSANISNINGGEIGSSIVNFDNEEGIYKFEVTLDDTSNEIFNSGMYISETIISSNSVERKDVKRLNGKDTLVFNINYNVDLNNKDYIDRIDHIPFITYKDGSIQKGEDSVFRSDIINTSGNNTNIKISCWNDRSKEIQNIKIKTLIKFKNQPTGSFELKYNLNSIQVFPFTDEEIHSTTFKVNKSSWYDFQIEYKYQIKDDNGYDLFPDDYYNGIYFNPSIHKMVNNTDVDYSFEVPINDGYNNKQLVKVNLKKPFINVPEDLTVLNKDHDIRIFSTSLKLARDYMFTLRLDHLNKSTGGGVGFVFDYDKENEQGYLLWISSTGDNPDIPEFSKEENWNIMKTGFYELDSIEGEKKEIFLNDPLSYIKVSNYKPIDIDGKYLKVIKINNRIRIYNTDIDDNTDFSRALIDIQDISNFHTNGSIEVIGLYASAKLRLIKYDNWNTLEINSGETDW